MQNSTLLRFVAPALVVAATSTPAAWANDGPAPGTTAVDGEAEGEGTEEAEGAAEADERAAALRELRTAALRRLDDDAARARFEAMSDEALTTLMNTEEVANRSPEEAQIVEAIGQEILEREFHYQTGDITIGDGLATLHLGEEFRYLSDEDAQKLLVNGWGNPPGSQTLGMIIPKDTSPLHQKHGWGVVLTYSEDGYVEDDDAEDIDYDDLLEEMKEDTAASNEQRKAAGYGSIELLGWAAAPRYEAETHRLYWAKELRFDEADEHTLNYAIRVLGRRGVLELNAVAVMSQFDVVSKEMERVLPKAEFETGHRYADFNPDMDEVAAYGLGGLIAGKVLAKAGIFAGLFKVLLALKKFLIIGVIGVGGFLAKLFKGKQAE